MSSQTTKVESMTSKILKSVPSSDFQIYFFFQSNTSVKFKNSSAQSKIQ